jgi:hypothetical protein
MLGQIARSAAALLMVALTAAPFAEIAAQGKKADGKGPRTPHIFSGPPPAHAMSIILGRPTDRSVVVSILANQETEAYVAYGPASNRLSHRTDSQKLQPRSPVEFTLLKLEPDAEYHYVVYVREKDGNEFKLDDGHHFHTARRPGSSFVFTMQADSHLDQGTKPEVYERSLAQALKSRTDFHIDLGDTFMTDKYPKHQEALPQYFAQRYYLAQLSHSAPLFMVLGNHDGERLDRYDGSPDCMSVWSCNLRKKLFPNPEPDRFYSGNSKEMKGVGRPQNYYAWHWGDALFIALDPFWTTDKRAGKKDGAGNWTHTLGKEQYDWLTKTLESSQAKYKFVFIHHLVGGLDESARGGSEAAVLFEWGGKDKDGNDSFKSRRPGWAMPIHALLVKYRVSAVFHGHDHFYARQELDGVTYQLVPQPGHPNFDRLRNAEEYGYFRGTFLPPSGILRVSVTPEKATVDYVRSYLAKDETANRRTGEVTYSYSIRPAR